VRGGAAAATGLDLATIWGCVTKNADMVPRLWFDMNAFEVFHGPGQALDQLSLFVDITGLPVLFVPLPISAPGVIRTQRHLGTGTSSPTVSVGSDGSLERVDGLLRVAQGGTVGVDQIQLEYSLDGGFIWTLFRLGTATSYPIPRTGHVLSFTAGTLVADEEILYWTSSAPTPADADITTARENLSAQGEQSRSWYLIRELEQETDVARLSTELETYDTETQRPLQAYAGIRRAFDRSGYKAQLSRTRSWMQGAPEIDFTQGAGPPNDTITRDAGSFIDDGFLDGDWITVTGATNAANNGAWKLSTAAAATLTLDVAGSLVSATDSGVTIWTTTGLEFVDGGVGDDTLVRNRGSWLDEGFQIGDTIRITGTASNDGDYLITDLTADTITVATGSFAAEEISSWDVTITATVLYPIDVGAMDAEFAPTLGQYKLELSYGHYWNDSLTYEGARLRYPLALVDMTRSYLVDVADTTWWEEQPGALSRAEEGWKGIDKDGQPFEYDERQHRRALPAGFTCGRTGPNTGSNTYIARALTRAGGSDALTQSHAARVTNAARIIVQRKTQAQTGRTFVTGRPDSQGRQFLRPKAISVLEGVVNDELARQLLGTTRRGEDERVSAVGWVAARDDDFSVQNPVLHGKLTVQTRKAIVTVDTAVEVI
jgi:hypothetical protein